MLVVLNTYTLHIESQSWHMGAVVWTIWLIHLKGFVTLCGDLMATDKRFWYLPWRPKSRAEREAFTSHHRYMYTKRRPQTSWPSGGNHIYIWWRHGQNVNKTCRYWDISVFSSHWACMKERVYYCRHWQDSLSITRLKVQTTNYLPSLSQAVVLWEHAEWAGPLLLRDSARPLCTVTKGLGRAPVHCY